MVIQERQGAIIRDREGHWVKGFSRSIGFTSSIMVELWAFRDGLRLASQLGIQNLEVEMDAKVIVDLINSNVNYNRAYSPLLHDCRLLLSRFPQVRVAHVFREVNKCFDALTKRGCSSQEDFVVFIPPPLPSRLKFLIYLALMSMDCIL